MEYSAQEICDLVSQATAKQIHIDLPSSKSGVKIRAEKEGWKSRIVQGKGGRNGQKTVYSLPNDVIKELQAKGLIPLLEKSHLENKVENIVTNSNVTCNENNNKNIENTSEANLKRIKS